MRVGAGGGGCLGKIWGNLRVCVCRIRGEQRRGVCGVVCVVWGVGVLCRWSCVCVYCGHSPIDVSSYPRRRLGRTR